MNRTLAWLSFGAVKPGGWLLDTMSRELKTGYVGQLDRIVPDLIVHDDIYGKDRLTTAVKAKNVGAVAQDADWEVQYLWWNSETQSNWWDGFVRTSLLVGDAEALTKAAAYVQRQLSNQDADGYLGIYAPDLRFRTQGENGELWALTTLGRSLLAWYEARQERGVLEALERACRLVMRVWPAGLSQPFNTGPSYAGAAHGLAATDLFNRLWELTGQRAYLEYAAFLYRDYNLHQPSETDILMSNLLDPQYRFCGHGVHTYEHLRSLLVARSAASGDARQQLDLALTGYLAKLEPCLTPSGGPIGDEWISPEGADASGTGYEYCSIQELLDSYTLLLQHTGDLAWGDRAEHLFFNAALGARHREGHSMAYLKTDNCLRLDGTGPSHNEGDKTSQQVRYKYSPAHQDAAVCCTPNAGRVFPTYLRSAWMQDPQGFTLALYGPSVLETEWQGATLRITQTTAYPQDFKVRLTIDVDRQLACVLTLRKPAWAQEMRVSAPGAEVEALADRIRLSKAWADGDEVAIEFIAQVAECQDRQGNWFVQYGPQLFCLDQAASERRGRVYAEPNFHDRLFLPTAPGLDACLLVRGSAVWRNGSVMAEFCHRGHSEPFVCPLVPMAWTLLRQVTFPAAGQ